MTASTSRTIACPSCATLNRVPQDRLNAGGKCGRCGAALFDGHPVTLTTGNFDAHLIKSDIPLLVDFWASWCGPCQMMAPAYEQAAQMLEPHVRLAKVNTEEEQTLAARFGISSIPTLVLLRGGRELARQSGALGLQDIVRWVRSKI